MSWTLNPFTKKLHYNVIGTGFVNKSGTPVQYDYARFTDADTVEGRSYSETLGDLSGEALAAFSFNDQNITNVGDISLDSISSDAGTSINVNLGSDAGDDFTVDTNKLIVEGDTGNVGIGTATPSQELDLIGDLELEDTTSSDTGVIYKGADRFIHNYHDPDGDGVGGPVPDGYNTFIGIKAGNFTMGSTATQTYHGSYNIGVGYQALEAITTGHYNSGFGLNVLGSVNIGSYNSGFGYNTLTNTTGSSNMAIGYSALVNNTTGGNNTALGYNAGRFQNNGATALQTPENSMYIGYNTKSGCAGNTVATCNTIVNDTGITGADDGTYNAVTTTKVAGNGDNALTVNVTISGGVITVVAVNVAGTGYRVNDTITITGLSAQVVAANDDGTFDVAAVGTEDTLTNEAVIGYNVTGNGSNTVTLGDTNVSEFHCQVALTVDSDKRIKKNITPVSKGLDFINALNPVTFKRVNPADYPEEIKSCEYKDRTIVEKDKDGKDVSHIEKAEARPEDNDNTYLGLIAQEVEAILRAQGLDFNLVNTSNRGKKSITYESLIIPLIKAVQELSKAK